MVTIGARAVTHTTRSRGNRELMYPLVLRVELLLDFLQDMQMCSRNTVSHSSALPFVSTLSKCKGLQGGIAPSGIRHPCFLLRVATLNMDRLLATAGPELASARQIETEEVSSPHDPRLGCRTRSIREPVAHLNTGRPHTQLAVFVEDTWLSLIRYRC